MAVMVRFRGVPVVTLMPGMCLIDGGRVMVSVKGWVAVPDLFFAVRVRS